MVTEIKGCIGDRARDDATTSNGRNKLTAPIARLAKESERSDLYGSHGKTIESDRDGTVSILRRRAVLE